MKAINLTKLYFTLKMQKVTFYEIEAILFFTFLTRGKTSSCVSTCHFVYYVIAFIVMGFLCSDSIYVTPSSKKCRLLKRGNLKETATLRFIWKHLFWKGAFSTRFLLCLIGRVFQGLVTIS